MDLEQDIKNIEELISEDRIALAIQALKELLTKDSGGFFSAESSNLLGLEARFNRNEKGFKSEGSTSKVEYDQELAKILQGIFLIRDNVEANPEKLGFATDSVNEDARDTETDAFFQAPESIVDKASKLVVLFLMAAAALLLIYFIAFHNNEETRLTGIYASGGVVFVSLFKQTLDKYIRLRFS